MCGIFEFSDFSQKHWKKIRFKFEIWEKITRNFLIIFFYVGITRKMNLVLKGIGVVKKFM